MLNMQSIAIPIDAVEHPSILQRGIALHVLRLDKIHPVVSGNKWFKLKYYLQDALHQGFSTLLTFGGAYSNHIAATAYAAQEVGCNAIGIIRGEEPKQWSHTLLEASGLGMQFTFVSRGQYNKLKRNTSTALLEKQFGRVYIIPEGGYGTPGIQGAAEILQTASTQSYTHIVSAVGTGTTIAGILQQSSEQQEVIGISTMKNNVSLSDEIRSLVNAPLPSRFRLIHDYHFGGYARHTPALFTFMNLFYQLTQIPLDFVYTAKMMYGIANLAEKDYFPPNSRVLAVHSGGLQGNGSLPAGTLLY